MPSSDEMDRTVTQAPRSPTSIADETLAQSADSLRKSAELSANDPRRVPGYDLFDEVGRGGMGIVYRAFDKSMKREVAVKILLDRYTVESSQALRFIEEAKITGQLQHPGIPAVYHVGRLENGRPFLAMKLIKGRTLDDLLKQKATIDSLAIFESISQAVGYAHSYGVIHRDLKPANIMVGAFGEVQVMDWGLAKVLSQRETPDDSAQTTPIHSPRDSDSSFTQAGAIMGTPAYMSPEQAAGAIDRVDARADVFGLGAILCVMLTGQPPYEGTSAESVLLNAVGGKTEAAIARLDASGAEPDVVDLCKRCLSIDPAHRPANAERLAEEIGHLRRASEERARNAERARIAADVRTAEALKRRRVWLALAALLVIGTATSVVLAIQSYRARKDAEKAHAETNKQKTRAEKQLTRAEWLVYANSIDDAQRHLRDGRHDLAREELDACRIDFRGWEHDYLFTQWTGPTVPLSEQSDSARCLAVSRDGTWIVSGHGDHLLKIWDMKSCTVKSVLPGHSDAVTCIAISPGQNRIISGSIDHTIRVWDSANFKTITELKGHTSRITCVAVTPDERRIVSGSSDGTIRIWDMQSLSSVTDLHRQDSAVLCLVLSTDGRRIISGGADRTIRIWDTETFAQIAILDSQTGQINSLAFNPATRQIVSSNTDGQIRIWDSATFKPIATLNGNDGISRRMVLSRKSSIAISPDGRWILSTFDRMARIWDARTFQMIVELPWVSDDAWSFSPNGKCLISSDRGRLRLWDIEDITRIAELKDSKKNIYSLAVSPDGSRIVSGGNENFLTVWDGKTCSRLGELNGHDNTVVGVAFSPDGRDIISGSYDQTIRFWDKATYQSAGEIRWDLEGAKSMSLRSDGRTIATGHDGGKVRLWDVDTRKAMNEKIIHSKSVECVQFSSNGRWLITGSTDKSVRISDSDTLQLIAELKGHSDTVRDVAVSADGKWIASASDDRTIRIWDASTLKMIMELKGHSGSVNQVAFCPDGQRLVSASSDNEVWLWETTHWSSVSGLKGHSGEVTGLCLSEDGKAIFSGSNKLLVFRATLRQPTTWIEGCSTAISVVFNSDGTRILARDATDKKYSWITATGQPAPDDEPIPDIPTSTDAWSPDGKFSVRIVKGMVQLRDEAKWTKFDAEMKRRLAEWLNPNLEWHFEQENICATAKNDYARRFHLRQIVRQMPMDFGSVINLAAIEAKMAAK